MSWDPKVLPGCAEAPGGEPTSARELVRKGLHLLADEFAEWDDEEPGSAPTLAVILYTRRDPGQRVALCNLVTVGDDLDALRVQGLVSLGPQLLEEMWEDAAARDPG